MTEHERIGQSKYAWSWDRDSRSWSLEADPRYQVKDFEISHPCYRMFIDGYEVDQAGSAAAAFAQLETRYEYEEHGAELALARLRLRQARERLEERFPRAAKDPALVSILEGLEDALGEGPEAAGQAPEREPDIYRRQLSPDLAVVLDASCCIVLEVSEGTAGRVLRRVAVGDMAAYRTALDDAHVVQRVKADEAEERRLAGRDEKRQAEGKLDRPVAVEWLMERGKSRGEAVGITAGLRAGTVHGDDAFGMTYDGSFWAVPVEQG
jgi:hypothetical protein